MVLKKINFLTFMHPILFLKVQNFDSILVLGLVLVQIFLPWLRLGLGLPNPILEKGLSNPQY